MGFLGSRIACERYAHVTSNGLSRHRGGWAFPNQTLAIVYLKYWIPQSNFGFRAGLPRHYAEAAGRVSGCSASAALSAGSRIRCTVSSSAGSENGLGRNVHPG
jgi:hypothetical protein